MLIDFKKLVLALLVKKYLNPEPRLKPSKFLGFWPYGQLGLMVDLHTLVIFSINMKIVNNHHRKMFKKKPSYIERKLVSKLPMNVREEKKSKAVQNET